LEKKHVGKHCSKTKTMWGNIITIHNVLKKKLRIKIDKNHFEKKRRKKFIKKKAM
jgi:hypothetical protein